jgi:aminoglycoside 3-N-acetyltransferase
MIERDMAALAVELRSLGVQPGQDLLVHSSLRKLGPVVGGAETVLNALRQVAGPDATIVVPTHTAGNSRSSRAFRAATSGLSMAEHAYYLASMPGFDPAATPSSGMGAFAEYVRTRPEAVRSSHPQTSFAALGPRAAVCTRGHALDCHLGESSPLGWLDRRGGATLLLGVGYAACTAFHLAEYLLPGKRPLRAYQCFTQHDGARQEHEFFDVELLDEDFEALGHRMDRESFVCHQRVGEAWCRLIPIQDVVSFALSDPAFQQSRIIARVGSHIPGARES